MNVRSVDHVELAQLLRETVRCDTDGDECRCWLVDGGCIVFTAYMAMLDVKHYDPEAAERELT